MVQQGSAQWFFPLVELLLPASRSGTPESDLRDAWPGHRAQRGILFGGGWEELGYGSYGSAGSGQSYFFSRTSLMLTWGQTAASPSLGHVEGSRIQSLLKSLISLSLQKSYVNMLRIKSFKEMAVNSL